MALTILVIFSRPDYFLKKIFKGEILNEAQPTTFVQIFLEILFTFEVIFNIFNLAHRLLTSLSSPPSCPLSHPPPPPPDLRQGKMLKGITLMISSRRGTHIFYFFPDIKDCSITCLEMSYSDQDKPIPRLLVFLTRNSLVYDHHMANLNEYP